MAGEKFVPSGVWLTCDKGTAPSQFTSMPKPVRIYGMHYATEVDKVPMVNIKPFVICRVGKPKPCTPIPQKWLQVKEQGTIISGSKPLLDCSQCLCGLGGKISIHMSKPAADAHQAQQNSENHKSVQETAHEVAEGLHEFAHEAREFSGKVREASNVVHKVSEWAFIGGMVLGAVGVAALVTGIGAPAAPFLFAAAGAAMRVSSVSYRVATGLDKVANAVDKVANAADVLGDVADFVAEPSADTMWVLVGDGAKILAGRLPIGNGLRPQPSSSPKNEIAKPGGTGAKQVSAVPSNSTNNNAGSTATKKAGKRRKNWLPDKGPPNTTQTNPSGTTTKKYGPDGNVQKEYNTGHGPTAPKKEQDDHVHDYEPDPQNPTGRGKRRDGRPPKRNEAKKDFKR